MFRRAREFGPALLVPFAWAFVTAAHLGVGSDQALLIAHVVMTVLLAGFAITGRADMQEGVLEVWWYVIVVGFFVTLSGLVGIQVETPSRFLQGIALVGWMVLPAVGFVYTGRRVGDGAWIYFGGAAGCAVGVLLYGAGVVWSTDVALVGGLTLVGTGQTAGILDAAFRY
ncbi:hypothetical protein [Halorientalis salina]|uniref:hypothetical protein n=1 Tax=Halorientalis salina TaxID=2932266 RepID=UPI0010AC72C9|nr:hypothetical protein [Halorientalis salina]